MTNKEELLNEIVRIEWDMFQNVPNIGGRALCQDDLKTFNIMRYSQGMSWSETTLESYLNDLQEAKREGRNLPTEKYARMMKSTSPLEYAQIEYLLPSLDPEVPTLIDRIVEIVLPWEEEISENFPYVRGRGRPIYSSEDRLGVASFETYLRAELATYSKKTLELYYQNVLELKLENINGDEVVLEYMVKQYGYNSLEEANERLKARA